MRSFQRTSSLLALTFLVCASCGDPDLNTDLDSAGPPEVNIVLVQTETGAFFGAPTFCRNGTDVRINRDICPELRDANDNVMPGVRDVPAAMDGQPIGWSVRLIFSELLNPNVEDLVDGVGTLVNTQPVTLTCGGTAVPYDGFYDPSGNDVTTPGGPALFIQPTAAFAAATGSGCEITVNSSVVDKDGNAVGEGAGPHTFGVAAMHTTGIEPSEGAEMVDPAAIPVIGWNAPVDAATLGGITLEETDAAGTVVAAVAVTLAVSADDPTVVAIVPDDGNGNQILLSDMTNYRLTLAATTGITDALGGPASVAADEVVNFVTGTFVPPDGGGADAAPADAGPDAT